MTSIPNDQSLAASPAHRQSDPVAQSDPGLGPENEESAAVTAPSSPNQGAYGLRRRLALLVAILGIIGVLIPFSQAAIEAFAMAQDTHRKSVSMDNVATFLTIEGRHTARDGAN